MKPTRGLPPYSGTVFCTIVLVGVLCFGDVAEGHRIESLASAHSHVQTNTGVAVSGTRDLDGANLRKRDLRPIGRHNDALPSFIADRVIRSASSSPSFSGVPRLRSNSDKQALRKFTSNFQVANVPSLALDTASWTGYAQEVAPNAENAGLIASVWSVAAPASTLLSMDAPLAMDAAPSAPQMTPLGQISAGAAPGVNTVFQAPPAPAFGTAAGAASGIAQASPLPATLPPTAAGQGMPAAGAAPVAGGAAGGIPPSPPVGSLALPSLPSAALPATSLPAAGPAPAASVALPAATVPYVSAGAAAPASTAPQQGVPAPGASSPVAAPAAAGPIGQPAPQYNSPAPPHPESPTENSGAAASSVAPAGSTPASSVAEAPIQAPPSQAPSPSGNSEEGRLSVTRHPTDADVETISASAAPAQEIVVVPGVSARVIHTQPQVTVVGGACFDGCSCWPVWSISIVVLVINLVACFVALHLTASLYSKGMFSSHLYKGGGYWLIGAGIAGMVTGGLIGGFVPPACWAGALYLGGSMMSTCIAIILIGRRGAWLGALGGVGCGGVIGFFTSRGVVGIVVGGFVGFLFGIVVGFAPVCRSLKINERYIRAGMRPAGSNSSRYSDDGRDDKYHSGTFAPPSSPRGSRSEVSSGRRAPRPPLAGAPSAQSPRRYDEDSLQSLGSDGSLSRKQHLGQ